MSQNFCCSQWKIWFFFFVVVFLRTITMREIILIGQELKDGRKWRNSLPWRLLQNISSLCFFFFFSRWWRTRSSTTNVNELQHHFFTLKFFFGLSVFLVASFEIIFWFILYALFSLPVRLVQCNNIIIESCYSENSSQRAVCIRVMFQW